MMNDHSESGLDLSADDVLDVVVDRLAPDLGAAPRPYRPRYITGRGWVVLGPDGFSRPCPSHAAAVALAGRLNWDDRWGRR